VLDLEKYIPDSDIKRWMGLFPDKNIYLQIEIPEKVPNSSFPDLIGESSILQNQRLLDSRLRGNRHQNKTFSAVSNWRKPSQKILRAF
jgi:hypothetical protein